MDVQLIATTARLPARLIRYVLDQKLLPGMRGKQQPHLAGRPRSFTKLEGYYIACAGILIQGGVRRQIVVEVIDHLVTLPWSSGSPRRPGSSAPTRAARPLKVYEALSQGVATPLHVSIGDGVHLRIQIGKEDTGWLEPRTGARLAENYRPRVAITLDLEELRQAFRKVNEF